MSAITVETGAQIMKQWRLLTIKIELRVPNQLTELNGLRPHRKRQQELARVFWFAAIALHRQIKSLDAQLADIDYELLKRLNEGLKRDVTPPQGPHRLVLPRRAARRFVAAVTFAREPIWDPASLELRAPPAQAL